MSRSSCENPYYNNNYTGTYNFKLPRWSNTDATKQGYRPSVRGDK